METFGLVASTMDPAFAVDLEGNIRAWNRSAEELFDRRSAEVVGRRCWDVVAGRDPFGNRYCGPGCPLLGMAFRDEAIHRSVMVVRTASEERARLEMSTFVLHGGNPANHELVHHFTQVGSAETDVDRAHSTLARGKRPDLGLTPRETEVLDCLAEGRSTDDIAKLLCISRTTVRNHIRHILRKLRSHSRLEALALARRLRII